MFLFMIIFYGRTYFLFYITTPKRDDIERLLYIYNFESLNSMGEKIFMVNGRFFYFNDDVKLEIYYIQQKTTPCG